MLWLLCRDSHKIHIFIGYCTLSGIKTPCPTFCLHLSDTPLPMLLFSPTLKHCFRWRGRSLFCDLIWKKFFLNIKLNLFTVIGVVCLICHILGFPIFKVTMCFVSFALFLCFVYFPFVCSSFEIRNVCIFILKLTFKIINVYNIPSPL